MSAEKRPEWMTSISATINPDDYLLGRKIDKTFELGQKEKADRAREARVELIAQDKIKLTGDPMLDLERKKQALRQEFLSNPIKLKQLRERLLREERAAIQDGKSQPHEIYKAGTASSSGEPQNDLPLAIDQTNSIDDRLDSSISKSSSSKSREHHSERSRTSGSSRHQGDSRHHGSRHRDHHKKDKADPKHKSRNHSHSHYGRMDHYSHDHSHHQRERSRSPKRDHRHRSRHRQK